MFTIGVSSLCTLLLLGKCAIGTVTVPFEKKIVTKSDYPSLFKRQSDTVDSTLQGNKVSFFIRFNIGTPTEGTSEQDFLSVLDTGSSDIFVLSNNSTFCQGKPENRALCETAGTFNAADSSTFQEVPGDRGKFQIQYADQTGASGRYGIDTVGFANISVTDVQFGIADDSSDVGVFGIGLVTNQANYASGLSDAPYVPLVEHMKQQQLIESRSYSLWLDSSGSNGGSKGEINGGSILFGGIDTSKFSGSLFSMPIDKPPSENMPAAFFVTLTGIKLSNNNDITVDVDIPGPFPVLLDSGTTYIYFPETVVQNIQEQFESSFNHDLGLNVLPSCSLRDSDGFVDFSFSNATIKVPVANLVVEALDKEGNPLLDQNMKQVCILAVQPNSKVGGTSILGDHFLSSAYVVFNLEQQVIGLAQSATQTSNSNIVPIISDIPGATPVDPVILTASITPGYRPPDPRFGNDTIVSVTGATGTGIFSEPTSAASGSMYAPPDGSWKVVAMILTPCIAILSALFFA